MGSGIYVHVFKFSAPAGQQITASISAQFSGLLLSLYAADGDSSLATVMQDSRVTIGPYTLQTSGDYYLVFTVLDRFAPQIAHLPFSLNLTCAACSAVPIISTQPKGATVQSGASLHLSVSFLFNPVDAVRWYEGERGDLSRPVTNGERADVIVGPLFNSTKFWARATNVCGAADSDAASVVVIPPPRHRAAKHLSHAPG